MQPLRYSINITLDGCYDHREGIADEELHRHAAETLERADALIFGRVVYEMMEEAWRLPARPDVWPQGIPVEFQPFARVIDKAKKYVVSSTITKVDWNSELIRGDVIEAVTRLKQRPGRGLLVGGVQLPMALAERGLIDEYQFVVHPRIAGHGPTLFSGLPKTLDLKLVNRREFASGAMALTYEPKR